VSDRVAGSEAIGARLPFEIFRAHAFDDAPPGAQFRTGQIAGNVQNPSLLLLSLIGNEGGPNNIGVAIIIFE
jgi:hypothetical protein